MGLSFEDQAGLTLVSSPVLDGTREGRSLLPDDLDDRTGDHAIEVLKSKYQDV